MKTYTVKTFDKKSEKECVNEAQQIAQLPANKGVPILVVFCTNEGTAYKECPVNIET